MRLLNKSWSDKQKLRKNLEKKEKNNVQYVEVGKFIMLIFRMAPLVRGVQSVKSQQINFIFALPFNLMECETSEMITRLTWQKVRVARWRPFPIV